MYTLKILDLALDGTTNRKVHRSSAHLCTTRMPQTVVVGVLYIHCGDGTLPTLGGECLAQGDDIFTPHSRSIRCFNYLGRCY